MIAGVVGAGIAGTEQPGDDLVGLADAAEQRMEAEAALVRPGGALLVRVGGDQGGVEVEGDVIRTDAVLPSVSPSLGPGLANRSEVEVGGECIDHPPSGGDRGHFPEEVRLVVQDRQVGEAVPTVGDADSEVTQHLTGVMSAPTLLQAGEPPGQRRGQPDPVGQLDQKVAAGVRNHPVAVRRHHRSRPLGTLHLESAPLFGILERSATRVSLVRWGTFSFPPQRASYLNERSRLEARTRSHRRVFQVEVD